MSLGKHTDTAAWEKGCTELCCGQFHFKHFSLILLNHQERTRAVLALGKCSTAREQCPSLIPSHSSLWQRDFMKHPRSLVIGKMKTNLVSFTVQRAKRWTLMLFSNQQEQLTRGPEVFTALELFKPKLEWSVCKPCNPCHSWNKLALLSKGITSGWRAHTARNTHSKGLFQITVSEPFQTFPCGYQRPCLILQLLFIVATWLVPTKLRQYFQTDNIFSQVQTQHKDISPMNDQIVKHVPHLTSIFQLLGFSSLLPY